MADDVSSQAGGVRTDVGAPGSAATEPPPVGPPPVETARPPARPVQARPPLARDPSVRPAFRDFVRVVRRYRWSVAFAVVAALALSLFLSVTSTPLYRAEASILVRPVALDGTTEGSVNMATEAEVLQSNVIGDRAADLLGLDVSGEDLASRLDVSTVEETEILELSYTADSRARARERAQAFVDGYLVYREELGAQAFEEARNAIQAELDALNESLAETTAQLRLASETEQGQLQTQISQITGRIVDRQLELTTVRSRAPAGEVLRAAAALPSAVSPDPIRDGVLGLVVGLLLGLSLAVVRDQLDDRVRNLDDVADELDAAVTFAVPRHHVASGTAASALVARSKMSEDAVEAYRAMAIELSSAMRRSGARSLLVTGASSRVGASTLTTHLALTLARSGRIVLVVSADIRDPSVEEGLGIRTSPGLVDVLERRLVPADAIVATSVPRLRVLPTGTPELRAPELLASEAMEALVPELEQLADIVLYDTPPVGERADALAAAQAVGRVVVVGTSEVTRPVLHATARRLRQVGAQVVAGVVTRADAPWLARSR